MTTQITNENEFNLDGVDYVAVPADSDTCKPCAFNMTECSTLNRPRCISKSRKDERNVVFIHKSSMNPLAPPLDLTRPVQTRSGLPVRILCTDRKHEEFKVVGLYLHSSGVEALELWTTDGTFSFIADGSLDLVNVPESPKPHVHAEIIKEWAANPSRVVESSPDGENWGTDCSLQWHPQLQYRLKK